MFEDSIAELYGRSASDLGDEVEVILSRAGLNSDDTERFIRLHEIENEIGLEYVFLVAAAGRPKVSVVALAGQLISLGSIKNEKELPNCFSKMLHLKLKRNFLSKADIQRSIIYCMIGRRVFLKCRFLKPPAQF